MPVFVMRRQPVTVGGTKTVNTWKHAPVALEGLSKEGDEGNCRDISFAYPRPTATSSIRSPSMPSSHRSTTSRPIRQSFGSSSMVRSGPASPTSHNSGHFTLGMMMEPQRFQKLFQFVAVHKARLFEASVDEMMNDIHAIVPMELKRYLKNSNERFATAGLIYVAHSLPTGTVMKKTTAEQLRRQLQMRREEVNDRTAAASTSDDMGASSLGHPLSATDLLTVAQGQLPNIDNITGSFTLDDLAMQNTIALHRSQTEEGGTSQQLTPQTKNLSAPSTVLEALQFGMFEKISRRLFNREEKERRVIESMVLRTLLDKFEEAEEALRIDLMSAEIKTRQKLVNLEAGQYLTSSAKSQDASRQRALARGQVVMDEHCQQIEDETNQFVKAEAKKNASSMEQLRQFFEQCDEELLSSVQQQVAEEGKGEKMALRRAHEAGEPPKFD